MKPGEITTTWEDGDQRPGYGIVVATSRHKDRLCLTEAATRLAAEAAVALVGRDVDHAPLYDLLSTRKTWFWHSVTKTEVEQDRHGCFAYCDPGGWCSRDVEDLKEIDYAPVLTVRGKGDKLRHVELIPRARAAIMRAVDGRTEGPMLLNEAGNRMNRDNVQTFLNRVVAQAGVKKHITPHCLRRTFIQLALDAGEPLQEVQRAVGHSSTNTTMSYDRRDFQIGRSPAYAIQRAVA